ncbi:hypothetical protein MMC07_000923 [Pseudocyphellaria aurata]|nr:hypothetical protein [Pseudocyphellaria aurata]
MSKLFKTDSGEVTDEDAISITSTVPSEPKEEYPVEAIIAEREVDGAIEYLVRWDGYPDERCTWEPESSFQSEDTLFEWKTQKMRVSRGAASPCNIEALLDRVEQWITASEKRKSLRRIKRMRLGMSVAPTENDMEDDGRQPRTGKEALTDIGQTSSNKGSSSKNDSTSAKRKRGTEQTDARIDPFRPQGVAGQEENTARNLIRNAPTAVMFHPQRQDDQSSSHPTSTAQTSPESPTKSSAGNLKKSTDPVKKPPPTRDTRPELHPQRQELQSSNNAKSTAQITPVPQVKSSIGTDRRTTDIVKKLPTARDALPEKESSNSHVRSNVPSTLPSKLTSNANRRGSATNVRPGIVGPTGSTKETHAPRQVQMGTSGRGPARLRVSNLDPSPTSPKRPSVTGAALLKNWNKNVKPRRSMAYQQNLQKTTEKAADKFGKLSIKRKYEKAGRNEPAPDIDKLVFIDLKPAAKKPSLSLPGLKIPSKTPFEMIQEGLNGNNTSESGFVETPVSNTSEAIAEQPASNANKANGQSAVSPEISTTNPAYNPFQVDAAAEPSEDNSPHPTNSPKKRPSLPFQAYRQQTASSSSAVPSNIIAPTCQSTSIKSLLPEKASEHQEMPSLLQQPQDPELQASNPIIASLSTDQEDEKSSIQNAHKSRTEISQSTPSGIPPISYSAPNLSTQASLPDLRKTPKNSYKADSTSTISVSNAPPGSVNEPTSLTQAIRSTTSLKIVNKTLNKNQTMGSFDLTEVERGLVASRSGDDVYGTLMIGPEGTNLGSLRFRVSDFTTKKLLLNIKVPPRQMNFWFQQICTADDYRTYYHTHPSGYLGTGHVLPYHQTSRMLKQVAETLKLHASGAIFTTPYFTMFMYPTDCVLENWAFLDEVQAATIPGSFLRFVLRNPLPAHDTSEVDLEVMRNQVFVPEGEDTTSIILHSLLGIDYNRLIQQTRPDLTPKSNNFFLLFPETAKPEYHVIFKFLEEHQANIFTWQTDGAWDHFCSNHVEAGVVLMEGGFYELFIIPNLWQLLKKPVNVFNITFQADQLAPHPHINRLFPHGCVFLITDSFLLLCPHEAARFMRWFRLQVLHNKAAGTWKMCTRPAIRDYILTLVENRDKEHGNIYMQIYESMWYILPEDLMEDDEWEVPKSEAPVYCMSKKVSKFDQSVGKMSRTNKSMDEAAIARNDSTQVYWFAGWAMTQLECFRKFQVICGARNGDAYEPQRKEWGAKWNHLEILTLDELFKQHKIKEWEVQEKERRERETKERKTKNDDREVRGSNLESTGSGNSSRKPTTPR